MRRFSDSEKATIKSIVTSYQRDPMQYVLVNAYNDIFYYCKVEFDAVNNQLIFYRKKDNIDLQRDLGVVIEQILETSLLLEYLEENNLIVLINTNSVNKLDKTGDFIKEDDDVALECKLDKSIADILYNSMNHRIFIGETLKVLVADGFMTTEDKLLESNRRLTQETINLSETTKLQMGEIHEQTQHTITLAQRSETQANEAKRLADEAEKQTREAHEQTIAAQQQAEESKRQTRLSYIAIFLSIVAIMCSYLVARFVIMDVKLVDEQYKCIDSTMNQIKDCKVKPVQSIPDSIPMPSQAIKTKSTRVSR